MTSIAEPAAPRSGHSWLRTLGLLAVLVLGPTTTPMPWAVLWFAVPLAVAGALLCAWRWGAWGVAVPVALFAVAMAFVGPLRIWVWWIPIAALTGAWMGLREEGGGPTLGARAWTLLPVLLFAALMPWMAQYPDIVARTERVMRESDRQALDLYRRIGVQGSQLQTLEKRVGEMAELQTRALPSGLPSLLFLWMLVLVSAGRGVAARVADRLGWPPLSRGRLAAWRLPDGALWLLLLGLALLLVRWPSWGPSGWTLLLNAALGYCVQGLAVVESLMQSRGIPSPIIALTFVFVFAMAWPAFMLATVCVGLSDVWLDYRRLEAVPDGDPS